MKLSIIVPCYNEEGNVSLLYANIRDSFKKFRDNYEIIFVNDGSNDRTLIELKKLVSKKEENITVINFSRNFGKEAAMLAGLEKACGEYISIIDGDMQQDSKIILDMIDILEKDDSIDVVATYQKDRKENKFISTCKKIFYSVSNMLSSVNYNSDSSDFRTFRSYVKDAIVSLHENNRFLKGIFSYIGFNTYYIPYVANKRASGKSKFSFKVLVRYALNGIMAFSTVPLKLITYLGIIMLLCSIVFLIVGLVINLDWFILMLFFLLSFFSSVILLALGIMSSYFSIIYNEIKNRPIYVTRDIIENRKVKKKSKKEV